MVRDATEALIEAAQSFGLVFQDTSPPKDQYLMSNNLRMHYLDWGTAGKPPLLFLHGGGQTAHTWDFTCLQLRHDYHCYALDQRGHGDSAHEEEVLADTFIQKEDIRGAVNALGLDGFVMIGMSMGGMNTIAYAGEWAHTLRGAVIVDVSPTVREEGAREIANFVNARKAFDSLEEAVEEAHRFNPARPKEHLKYSLLHNLRQDPDGKWRWKYDRGPRPLIDPDRLRAQRRELMERLWNEVPKITCPVLVVHGAESKVQRLEDAQAFCERLPNARLVSIPGAGHTVQGDRPKEFVEALRAFFQEIGYV